RDIHRCQDECGDCCSVVTHIVSSLVPCVVPVVAIRTAAHGEVDPVDRCLHACLHSASGIVNLLLGHVHQDRVVDRADDPVQQTTVVVVHLDKPDVQHLCGSALTVQ